MSKREYISLSQTCDFRSDRIDVGKLDEYSYISTENMIENKGGITNSSKMPNLKKVPQYKENDILLSNIRPYFKKIWFATFDGGCSNDVLVLDVYKNVNPKFLYYVLADNNFFNYATVTSKGTKMPRGSKKAIMKYLVPDISKDKQKKIADILSAYDDLIENNNRRIKLLEQSAQELYKEWFVRFRFPGYKAAKFEKGLPVGWEVTKISDYVFVTDGTHDTPKPTDSGCFLITGKSIVDDFIDFSQAYYISEDDHIKISKRSGLDKGDIILSNIGTIGTACIIDYEMDFSVKNVIIFKCETSNQTSLLYCMLKNNTTQSTLQLQASGATQKFISLTYMRKYKFLLPTKELVDKFDDIVQPLLQEKNNLYKQNQNLKKQRDLLLPRLMSGKLEV